MQKALILILLLFLSGCAIKRVSSDRPYNSGMLTTEQLIDSVLKRNISNDGYFIEKAEILIKTKGKTEKYVLTAKFQAPDKFLVSIKSTAGIEGARIFITGDSVFVNDRINRKLLSGKASLLERKTGIPGGLEKITFGDLVFNKDNNVKKYERADNQVSIGNVKDNYDWKINIDPALRKVRSYEIRNIISGKTGTLIFEKFSKGARPVPLMITFEDKERNISAKLIIARYQIPWNGEIEFIPGKGYTKEELK